MTESSKQNEALIHAAFENAVVGLACLDINGRILLSNSRFLELLAFKQEQIESLKLDEIIHPKDQILLSQALEKLSKNEKNQELQEVNCFDGNGKTCWLNIKLSLVEKDTTSLKIIAVFEKPIRTIETLENPYLSRQLFEGIAESIPTTVWLSDIDGKKIHFVNQAFLDTWEISREQAKTCTVADLLDRLHPQDREHISNFSKEIHNDRWNTNIRINTPEKGTRHLESSGTVLRNKEGRAKYLLGTHHDVTDSVIRARKLETLNQQLQDSYEEVTRLNQFDPLTGCYNRTSALVYISDAYYQFKRYDISSCLIYIDLNKFKDVNDQYGHHAGDLVLKNFVNHMQNRIRQTDTLGRLGGDEFILLLPGTNKENSLLFLQKELSEFTTQITDELNLTVTYAAGVQECNFDFESVEDWLDASDKAMYAEKNIIS